MRIRAALLSLLAFFPVTVAEAADERRIALILGNGDYPGATLQSPLRDATDLATILKDKLGFEVLVEKDATITTMRRLASEFKARSAGARYALVFFGGYAVNDGKESYLLGVDSPLGASGTAKALNVSEIVAAIDGNSDAAVLLDASYRNASLQGSSNGKIRPGLAHIPDARDGVAIISAQQPGRLTSSPDSSGGGVLATAVNIWLNKPKVATLGRFFDGIYESVVDATQSEQEPWLAASKGTRIRVASLSPLTMLQGTPVQAGLTPQIFTTASGSEESATGVPAGPITRVEPQTPTGLTEREIAVKLQIGLQEKRCFTSEAETDGQWGDGSRQAMSRFVEVASAADSSGASTVLRDIDVGKGPTQEMMVAFYSPVFKDVRCPFAIPEPPVVHQKPDKRDGAPKVQQAKEREEPVQKPRKPKGLAKAPTINIPQF